MSPELKQYVNVKTLITAIVLAVLTFIGGCGLNKLNDVKDGLNTVKELNPVVKQLQQNDIITQEKFNQQNVVNAVMQQNFNDLKEALKDLQGDVKQVIRQTK